MSVNASDGAADACNVAGTDQDVGRGLRIGGLFIILAVSSLGVMLPHFLGRRFTSAFFLARTFGAGVIIATAFVHVLADASEDLFNPCLGLSGEYPWANAIATTAVLLTFALEYTFGYLIKSRMGGVSLAKPSVVAMQEDPTAVDPEAPADANAVDEKALALARLDATVASYSLESGIIIHSIFVGLAYGAETDYDTIRALTIALGFHQGIEGISLACTFLDAGYSTLKYALFSLVFILITPIGVAIGLALGTSYNPGSKRALGTQGTLNAIAAGILVYNGIVDLLLPAFGYGGHSHGITPKRTKLLTLAGFLFLFAGCAIQSLIGKWA